MPLPPPLQHRPIRLQSPSATDAAEGAKRALSDVIARSRQFAELRPADSNRIGIALELVIEAAILEFEHRQRERCEL